VLFAWGQEEEEGAMIEKGYMAIFDDVYDNFEKKSLELEGEKYQVPYPYDKNILEQDDKDNASYLYIDYDLTSMEKIRGWLRKQYSNIKDESVVEERLQEHEAYIKSNSKVDTYYLNSPMTVKAINNDKLNVVEFAYSDIIAQFHSSWGQKHWDFTGLLDNNKSNRQSFAMASSRGSELDMQSFYSLSPNTLYQIDYKKYYNNNSKKVLYNKEELRYWCYGYYLAKMNFSYKQAISLGMQFFDASDVTTFVQKNRVKDLPWRIDALLDGYSCYYSDKNLDIISVPYIDMYEVFQRNPGVDEFDIYWDLNEFTLDMVLVSFTGGTYSIGKTSIQVGSKFTMGAAIDITLQIALAKLDGSTSNEEAYQQIVWSDVIYSGVETLHSRWATQSAMACMRTAFNEMGSEYDYNTVITDCGVTFATNFFAYKLLGTNDRFSKHIRKCLGKDASETINGLWVLGLDKETVEWIVAHTMGESFKKGISSIIDNQFKNGKKR
jgi:hypothetical protein